MNLIGIFSNGFLMRYIIGRKSGINTMIFGTTIKVFCSVNQPHTETDEMCGNVVWLLLALGTCLNAEEIIRPPLGPLLIISVSQ